MEEVYHVYIMSSVNRTLYIGITGRFEERVLEHKEHVFPKSFTSRYNISKLVYFEAHQSSQEAIAREKQIKRWNRAKKIALIERYNPAWKDLYEEL